MDFVFDTHPTRMCQYYYVMQSCKLLNFRCVYCTKISFDVILFKIQKSYCPRLPLPPGLMYLPQFYSGKQKWQKSVISVCQYFCVFWQLIFFHRSQHASGALAFRLCRISIKLHWNSIIRVTSFGFYIQVFVYIHNYV